MQKRLLAVLLLFLAAGLSAQELTLTEEENAAVAAILAKAQSTEQKDPEHLSAPAKAQVEANQAID